MIIELLLVVPTIRLNLGQSPGGVKFSIYEYVAGLSGIAVRGRLRRGVARLAPARPLRAAIMMLDKDA